MANEKTAAYRQGYADVLAKFAASRIDKALAAGQVAFKDVMPKIKTPVGAEELKQWKQLHRSVAQSPAPRPRAEVARTRALNRAKYEQATKNTGVPGVSVSRAPGPEEYIGVPFAQRVPGTVQAHVPDDAPELMRYTAISSARRVQPRDGSRDFDRMPRPHGGTKIPEANLAAPRTPAADPSILHATTQHEIGEARTLVGAPGTRMVPHASHLGVEPTLRENLALLGDPTAQRIFGALRKGNPDDARVKRLIAQMGGTPDAPIPLDSRRSRALEKQLTTRPELLSDNARAIAFGASVHAPEVAGAQKLVPPRIAAAAEAVRERGHAALSREEAQHLSDWTYRQGAYGAP